MFKTRSIYNEFVRIAEGQVGCYLHSPDSVYISRDSHPTSFFPYITFDILSIDDTNSYLLYEGVDENDDINYLTNLRVLVQYTVKGEDSLQICNRLRSSFRKTSVLNSLKKEGGIYVEEVLSITSTPERLSTTYQEAASFTIIFNINDVTTEDKETGGVITRVSLEGEMKRNKDDDTPLNLDIDEASPDHV